MSLYTPPVPFEDQQFSLTYDDGDEAFSLRAIFHRAREKWPGITPDEVTVRALASHEPDGHTITTEIEVEPTESYWRRTLPQEKSAA